VTAPDGQLLVHPRHPISDIDAIARTITGSDGGGSKGAREMATGGANAIKLSEKAAAVLQGFPPNWVFSGATKRARWSMLGQAMPPPLAEAVGRSIARAMQLRARKASGA